MTIISRDLNANNKIGIVVGAGASSSIDPKIIPVMNNFFKIANDFAQNDEKIFRTIEILKKYKLLSSKKIPDGNLENVLTETLSLPRDDKNPWKRPYDGLLLTLHSIFYKLTKQIDLTQYTERLQHFYKFDPRDITFISFNYDVFLEMVLEKIFSWEAEYGYLNNVIVGYIDKEQAEQAQKPYEICDEVYAYTLKRGDFSKKVSLVLKPHGSLNWFIHSESPSAQFWMSKNTIGLLLMKTNNGKVCIPEYWDFPTTNSVEGELANQVTKFGGVLPAIIPPGEKYSNEIPVFKQIENNIELELRKISTLIIIGWSMRQSDKKYIEIFNKVRENRKNKMNIIAVIDYNQREEFFLRFKNLLNHNEFMFCNDGFMSKSSNDFLKKIIDLHQN